MFDMLLSMQYNTVHILYSEVSDGEHPTLAPPETIYLCFKSGKLIIKKKNIELLCIFPLVRPTGQSQ